MLELTCPHSHCGNQVPVTGVVPGSTIICSTCHRPLDLCITPVVDVDEDGPFDYPFVWFDFDNDAKPIDGVI